MPENDYQFYWNKNIADWGEYYLDISHGQESLNAPRWLSLIYKATVGRLEKRLMRERYRLTINFLNQHARPGAIVSDLGCGTGIFVVEALKRGASVNAIDFTAAALDITRKNVERYCPGGNVTYLHADVQRDQLPHSDVTLAMGLTPYLTDLPAFLKNALSRTNQIYCLYVDPDHPANRIRAALPVLDVRGLRYYRRENVDALYAQNGWGLVERRNFATGFIDWARA